MIKVVDKVTENMKSSWGSVNITVSLSVLEDLKQGKKLVADIFDEYSVIISIGDELRYEEEC